MLTPKEIAEQGTFLIAEVGSSVHGLSVAGKDDLDLMGVCFQPPEYLLGLQSFQQFIYRTAQERAKYSPEENQKRHGQSPKSEAGDVDLTIYSVQKFLKLALNGNPSVLVLLFSPKTYGSFEIKGDLVIPGAHYSNYHSFLSNTFLELASSLASKQAGPQFLGYLRAQKERMLGQRGQMRVTRTDLISQYGFDSKFACHACRLGIQGIEYMKSGKLQLPMAKNYADTLMSVRMGDLTFSEVIDWIEKLEEELKDAIDSSPLPRHPDYWMVDKWLVRYQLEFFKWRRDQRVGANADSPLIQS